MPVPKMRIASFVHSCFTVCAEMIGFVYPFLFDSVYISAETRQRNHYMAREKILDHLWITVDKILLKYISDMRKNPNQTQFDFERKISPDGVRSTLDTKGIYEQYQPSQDLRQPSLSAPGDTIISKTPFVAEIVKENEKKEDRLGRTPGSSTKKQGTPSTTKVYNDIEDLAKPDTTDDILIPVKSARKTPKSTKKTPLSESKTPVSTSKTPLSTSKTPASVKKTPAPDEKTPSLVLETPISESKTPISNKKTPKLEKEPDVEASPETEPEESDDSSPEGQENSDASSPEGEPSPEEEGQENSDASSPEEQPSSEEEGQEPEQPIKEKKRRKKKQRDISPLKPLSEEFIPLPSKKVSKKVSHVK